MCVCVGVGVGVGVGGCGCGCGCGCACVCVCVDHLNRCKTSIRFSLHYFFVLTLHDFTCFNFHAGGDRVAAWLSPTKLHAVD